MRNINITLYKYDELSDKAKDNAYFIECFNQETGVFELTKASFESIFVNHDEEIYDKFGEIVSI